MTEEEIKMSEEREATLNAGMKRGKNEMLDAAFEASHIATSIALDQKIKKRKKL